MPEDFGQMMKIEAALASGQFTLASSLIDDFDPQTNIESNYKDFFKSYHEYYTTDTITGDNNYKLSLLINQCPATDGPAVYKARVLYNQVYKTITDFNDDNCVPEGYSLRPGNTSNSVFTSQLENNERQKQKLKPSITNEYKIFPNPTDNHLYIRSKSEKEELVIDVVDVAGRVLIHENLNSRNNLNVIHFDLTNGIYFVLIKNSKGTKQIQKLVITK